MSGLEQIANISPRASGKDEARYPEQQCHLEDRNETCLVTAEVQSLSMRSGKK